jgi:hypothetical protein
MVVVTLIATESKALAGNFFAGMTMMTLVTAVCGHFQGKGPYIYCVGSLTPST